MRPRNPSLLVVARLGVFAHASERPQAQGAAGCRAEGIIPLEDGRVELVPGQRRAAAAAYLKGEPARLGLVSMEGGLQ